MRETKYVEKTCKNPECNNTFKSANIVPALCPECKKKRIKERNNEIIEHHCIWCGGKFEAPRHTKVCDSCRNPECQCCGEKFYRHSETQHFCAKEECRKMKNKINNGKRRDWIAANKSEEKERKNNKEQFPPLRNYCIKNGLWMSWEEYKQFEIGVEAGVSIKDMIALKKSAKRGGRRIA